MKLLILTTATNRPEVHKKSFRSYRDFLDPSLDITWLVNIDYIEDFEASLKKTQNNIEKIFKDHKNIKFKFFPNKRGWMNKAVRNLIAEAKGNLSDYDCVLYLEDDWFYSNPKGVTFLDTFDFDMDGKEYRFFKKKGIVLLSKRVQVEDITLQPTIWTKEAFGQFIKVIEESGDFKSCPETILEESYGPINIRYQYPLFKDIGREWLTSKGLTRPTKDKLGERNPNYAKDVNEETYQEYIERCRNFDTGYNVSEFTLDVNGKKVGIELPPNYDKLVSSISKSMGRKMKAGEYEVDARGNVSKILGAFDIKGAEELGEWFAKELSEKLYGGECFINHIHPYKNNMSDRGEAASWIWHYDNVAPGLIKILVYLNDTTDKTGAFLTLKNRKGEYPLVKPSKISPSNADNPMWPGSRVPDKIIKSYEKSGYRKHYIEGPKGTFILFNNNIIHKATIPQEKPERKCIIFHFRPYHTKLDKHIGKEITWDWRSRVNSKTYHYDIIETSRWQEVRGKLKSYN